MDKLTCIIDCNNQEKIIGSLMNLKCNIIENNIKNLNAISTKYTLLIYDFKYYKKNIDQQIKDIINKKYDIVSLSNDKNVILIDTQLFLSIVNKNHETILKKKIMEYYNEKVIDTIILFSDILYADPIEYIIINDSVNMELYNVYKQYLKSYISLFKTPVPFNSLNLLSNRYFNDKKCYYFMYFVNDKNVDDFLMYTSKFKYKHARGSIFINCKIDDNVDNIIRKVKTLKNFSIIMYTEQFSLLLEMLKRSILWFENIVVIKDIIKDNIIDDLNIYHKHYDVVCKKSYISMRARYFSNVTLFGKNDRYIMNNIFDIIVKYICIYTDKDSDKIYFDCAHNDYNKKETFVNVSKNRNEHIIQNLMTIRDYEYTKNFITKKYENGEQIINYYMRKIGLFFLMGNSEKIEFEINAIIDIINDFGTLEKLYYLIVSSTININIKKKICIKLLKSGISEHITHKIMESVYSSIIKVDLNENELYELIEITDYFISNNILQEYQHVLNILSLHIRNHITNTKLHEKFKKITNINIDADTLYSIDEIEVLLNNKKISIEYLYSLISNFDPYYKSYEKMCKKRKLIKDLIDYLCEKEIKQYTLDTIVLLHPNNFYLSYQGLSSKDIFMARSKLMRKICENLNFKIDTNFNNKKINICFHSNFLSRTHSVYKDRHQVIKYLSNDERFNVYFTTFDPLDEKVRDTFGKAKHIKLPINLTKIKELLTNLKLDYLVYCEIGMCPLTYYVAHMKLAKKQYVTWGHSDTSGIDTIDCFISSKYYELEYEKSQENYSEKLILLNSLCTYYINPAEKYKMHKFKNRNHYGFTNEYKIFFCAQSAFKLNIIFIDYLIEIMEKNPTAILIFSKNEFVDKHLELLENKNISFRIHYYPNQSHYDYMNLIYISDIVLDPFPFGGCNSSLESFSLNKPIVTQASNMINGRFTSGFYKKMQMDDMINNSRIEYINMVQKLVNNEEFYNECSLSINNKKHLLFEDNETLEDWKNLFIKESS